MKATLLNHGSEKSYALIFAAGDEVIAGLTTFARRENLSAARFSAIGAFSQVTLGYYNLKRQQYDEIKIAEQVEALSLNGDIALKNGKPQIHAHVVVGTASGDARGGHLLRAIVRPTLEVMLTESPVHLQRKFDKSSGLALIDVSQPTMKSKKTSTAHPSLPMGACRWAIADNYIPKGSHGPSPAMISHEAVCILNTGDKPAHVKLTIFYSDRAPVGPYKILVPGRRTRHVRYNDLKDPKPILHGADYASVIESDVPIVVQHTRLDSRQAENALMTTIAYHED